jgi:hypothetical protein
MKKNGHQAILHQCPPAPEPECKDPWEEPCESSLVGFGVWMITQLKD